MTKTLWHWDWEQDGRGGFDGLATYFPGTPHETTVYLPDFKTAHALYNAIAEAIKAARQDARAGLLAQIGRIEP